MLKQKVFFDTNVCNEIARRSDASKFLSAVGKRFKLVASPMVFAELVNGLHGSNAQHWEQQKNRIRAAVGNGQITFLKLPTEFAFQKVLAVTKLGKVSPAKCIEWTRLILSSNSRNAVFESSRELGYMVDTIRDGWKEHSIIVLATTKDTVEMPSADHWAQLVAEGFDVEVNSGQGSKLASALSFAYERIVYLRQQYSNPNSNPESLRGDWVDVLNLYYLCDPAIRFVTLEGKLIRALNLQGQVQRLSEYRQFVDQLEFP